ncbi:MAG: phosphoribosylformylglycinamidine synthase subunit PurL [Fimbriimonadaceae bacterium]|nr:phosphoribosylformylglycinamidine synthase subunit PurL [Fimbriimonadaceae bacterium]
MPPITPEVYRSMGLLDSEYARIVEQLGREPSLTELGMYAVMWSEHCGYKYSRPILAYFKKYREALEGQGLENAGVIDIGDGLGVTMKVESHNHPSAVEPYQGAATGVGGIIRDILTMGARPIAMLNSLRFGPLASAAATPDAVAARNRYLFEHVVEGIAGYGNCVGVPTVAGEVQFHPRYSGNPLVNAMCVGLMPLRDLTTAAASGIGNPVIYLGSATGKDGIHGATFASDALGEDQEEKRPNVQIGDPFAEKLLIEATLEALATGAIVAIQDMGAAGLTCSTVEMAAKGKVGMEVDLDRVPMRERDMTAYELMLSESQERMLAVAHAGREEEVLEIFRRWGTQAEVIGHVIEDRIVRVRRHGVIEAEVYPNALADECPVYFTENVEPAYFREAATFSPAQLPSVDATEALLKLLASPNVASKAWVYRQFDQQVQTQTKLAFGQGDAAVIAPRGTNKGLAVKIDGNARKVFLHPYHGAVAAVAEAARNVACTGARPVAMTDGLNFGNPQHPHVYWQFERAVKGIADACEALQTPVVSGNVSFYNQSDLGEVPPTPMMGALGVLDSAEHAIPSAPTEPCDLVMISVPLDPDPHGHLGGSEYLAVVHGLETGHPAMPNLAGEAALANLLVDLAARHQILSAHDVSDGGYAVALAEIAIDSNLEIQANLDLDAQGLNGHELFAEPPGVVFVGTHHADAVIAAATAQNLRANRFGRTYPGEMLMIKTRTTEIGVKITRIRDTTFGAIPSLMGL